MEDQNKKKRIASEVSEDDDNESNSTPCTISKKVKKAKCKKIKDPGQSKITGFFRSGSSTTLKESANLTEGTNVSEPLVDQPSSSSADSITVSEDLHYSGCDEEEATITSDGKTCDAVCCKEESKPYQPTETAVLSKSEREFITKGIPRKEVFLAKWYSDYQWLTFCTTTNKAFCYICCAAQRRQLITFSKNVEEAFTTAGFNNWKKATERFKEHEQCGKHKEAVLKLATSKNSVETLLSDQQKKEQISHQKALVVQIESLRYLLRQG